MNRRKQVYDGLLLLGVLGYILVYTRLGPHLQIATARVDEQTLVMKAYGSCAFILLTLVLSIGPLARLDRRFLPLLYNRRHFGVVTCTVALAHGAQVLGWYFAFSPLPPVVALLAADDSYGQLHGFPFIPFGIAALAILVLLAATSHDFWLVFLTPPVWKAMHMTIYAAYALVVLHVSLGYLQSSVNPIFAVVLALSCSCLVGLHLAAGLRERMRDRAHAAPADSAPWVVAATVDAIAEGHAIVVPLRDAEPVAIFRHDGRLSAVTNLCAHQNGPLGEGRIVDGCITCPWHGYQYRVADGCAPPPFTERIATYRLMLDGSRVLLDPRPNPPGTFVQPLAIATAGS
jgi:nitrite reductase/ring-hydroxylating ferredoxin subunit/DMSO/TMAO reductase YedYZ heme-binding membrane subunit